MNPKRFIVVPTWNEREGIGAFVEAMLPVLSSCEAKLIFVDDASPDGTGVFLDDLARRYPVLSVIHRTGLRGFGKSYLEGFRRALEQGATEILQMDSDLSHPPLKVIELFKALENADLAVGSRYVEGGGTRNWPAWRRAISRGGSLYARAFLGFPLRDFTGGFNAWRADLLRDILEPEPESNGYSFQIEMKLRALRRGGRFMEIPFEFLEREAGTSKMSARIVFEASLKVLRWSVKPPKTRKIPRKDAFPPGI